MKLKGFDLKKTPGSGASYDSSTGVIHLSASDLSMLMSTSSNCWYFYALVFQLGHEGGHAINESSSTTVTLVEPTDNPFHLIAASDYAKQVSAVYRFERAINVF